MGVLSIGVEMSGNEEYLFPFDFRSLSCFSGTKSQSRYYAASLKVRISVKSSCLFGLKTAGFSEEIGHPLGGAGTGFSLIQFLIIFEIKGKKEL